MTEFRGGRIVSAAALSLASALFAAGCSSSEKPSSPAEPPLAKAGEVFKCKMLTPPETLSEAGMPNAANTIAPAFHEPATEIEEDARYGLALCQRSITAAMAKAASIVVDVPGINPDFTCITWSADYKNAAQEAAGGPTDHIGLICVPKVASTTIS